MDRSVLTIPAAVAAETTKQKGRRRALTAGTITAAGQANHDGGVSLEPILVPIDTAGQLLGVGRSTIYGLLSSGELESRKLGKRNNVVFASLKRLAASLPKADIRLGRKDAA